MDLSVATPPFWLTLVVGALALVAGGAGALAVARQVRAVRMRMRMARARAREAQAAEMLRRAGYAVLESQPRATSTLLVNGQPLLTEIRADYLVRRWGRLYVAEAKSGTRAPDPTERGTRRQLLEYATAYAVSGVLLVDTEAGTVARIDFPALRRPFLGFQAGFWLGVGVGAGIAGGVVAALGPLAA